MKPIVALRHVPQETLGTIEPLLDRAEFAWHYCDWFRPEAAPPQPDEIAALIVLGGPMNVDQTDRYPFLATEVDVIRRVILAGIPTLGICLGAQLMSKSLGANVWAAPRKEIGWYDLELTPAAADDALLAACPPRTTVFQWHGDTFDLPDGAVHLARSSACEHQAFRFGDSAWALQFHLEVTGEMIEDWLSEPAGCAEVAALDYVDPDQIRAESPRLLPALHTLADQVFSQFIERIVAHAGAS